MLNQAFEYFMAVFLGVCSVWVVGKFLSSGGRMESEGQSKGALDGDSFFGRHEDSTESVRLETVVLTLGAIPFTFALLKLLYSFESEGMLSWPECLLIGIAWIVLYLIGIKGKKGKKAREKEEQTDWEDWEPSPGEGVHPMKVLRGREPGIYDNLL